MRRCYVSVVKPENHTMSINGVAHPVSKVTCDACTEDLHTKIGVAITEWSYGFNPEPRPWEHEYGTIISKEAADAAEVLGGKGSS
jgi:hypothetical protein